MKKPKQHKFDLTDPEEVAKFLTMVSEDMIHLREGLASLCGEVNRIRAFDKILMRVMDKAGIIDEPDVKKLSEDLYKKEARELIRKYNTLKQHMDNSSTAYESMEQEYPETFNEDDFDEYGNPKAEA